MTHPLTLEQEHILDQAVNSSDNLLISALAGAAKTTMLEAIAHALPRTEMLCLAFNKKIAVEMQEKLPPNCRAQTLNSLGLAAWKDTLPGKITVDLKKSYRLLMSVIDGLQNGEKKDAYSSMPFVLASIRLAKAMGHIPDALAELKTPARLLDDAEMFAELEDEPTDFQQDLILQVLIASTHESLAGRIDFDDMLLFPTVYRAVFPRFPLVMIDEAQDLSPLNHAMLAKIAKRRIIAVGDQCQAIYAFRGASSNGMMELKEQFSMHQLTLSTTFRCPEEIVEHVRWRAPDMKSWSGTPEGQVHFSSHWSIHDIPDGAAIICRNNAPLFNMAISLLREGRSPNLWGNDIAAGLIKIMKKFGAASMSRTSALSEVAEWETAKLKKTRQPRAIQDRAECLRIFIRATDTLGAAIKYASHVLDCEGPIQLMTGHKSKGHQFRDVYFLDSKLVGTEGQEPNLRYVICTRAERNLTYIGSDSCLERTEEEG